ncbi:BLUF domain-containing protein [Sphingomonas sp.]|uniref:BLUF domain-containing protein n=1 Tax=Sphingomonas sp. TaxID=28214 RepID=UPI001B15B586|nr:BLUF domain-containing protein [Sphingomonas sp.]MBO9712605.1 BLUF domain-containing protein [Sphingomonas sp.]
MFQLVYVSSVVPETAPDPEAILRVSRVNNARDGITGLLYSDERRFLQVLEGEPLAVEQAFARIQLDPRHRAIVVLLRREIEAREFGDWAMAHRTPGDDADAFIARVAELVAHAAPAVRGTFQGFAEARRAA